MSNKDEKELELHGRKFRLKKYDPYTAMYWAQQLFGDLAKTDFNKAASLGIQERAGEFLKMNREKQAEFMHDALRHASYEMNGAFYLCVDTDRNPVIPNASNPLIFSVAMASFAHTLSDFFQPETMKELMGATGLAQLYSGNMNE